MAWVMPWSTCSRAENATDRTRRRPGRRAAARASSGSAGCGPAGVPCSPAPMHLADADRERRHQVEPEPAEVVGADDDGHVGAGGRRPLARAAPRASRKAWARSRWSTSAHFVFISVVCDAPTPITTVAHRRATSSRGVHVPTLTAVVTRCRVSSSRAATSTVFMPAAKSTSPPSSTTFGQPDAHRGDAAAAQDVGVGRTARRPRSARARRRRPPPRRPPPRRQIQCSGGGRLPGIGDAPARCARRSVGAVAQRVEGGGELAPAPRAATARARGAGRRAAWRRAGTTAAMRPHPASTTETIPCGATSPVAWRTAYVGEPRLQVGGDEAGVDDRVAVRAAGGGRRRRCGCRRRSTSNQARPTSSHETAQPLLAITAASAHDALLAAGTRRRRPGRCCAGRRRRGRSSASPRRRSRRPGRPRSGTPAAAIASTAAMMHAAWPFGFCAPRPTTGRRRVARRAGMVGQLRSGEPRQVLGGVARRSACRSGRRAGGRGRRPARRARPRALACSVVERLDVGVDPAAARSSPARCSASGRSSPSGRRCRRAPCTARPAGRHRRRRGRRPRDHVGSLLRRDDRPDAGGEPTHVPVAPVNTADQLGAGQAIGSADRAGDHGEHG